MSDSTECLSLSSLLGLTEKEASLKIKAAEHTSRVVCRDGEWDIVTCEYQFDRVNLTIEKDLVTKATIG